MIDRTTLAATAAAARFPLYGIPVEAWDGPALIGTVRRHESLEALMLVYLDMIDERSMGACVSSVDARLTAGGTVDAFEAHLVPFIARYDDAFLTSRVKRGRFEPFRPGELTAAPTTVDVGGRRVAATVHTHVELPVTLVRAPVRAPDGITDLGIAGWRLDPAALAPSVVRIDPAFVARFDAATAPDVIDLADEGEP